MRTKYGSLGSIWQNFENCQSEKLSFHQFPLRNSFLGSVYYITSDFEFWRNTIYSHFCPYSLVICCLPSTGQACIKHLEHMKFWLSKVFSVLCNFVYPVLKAIAEYPVCFLHQCNKQNRELH